MNDSWVVITLAHYNIKLGINNTPKVYESMIFTLFFFFYYRMTSFEGINRTY